MMDWINEIIKWIKNNSSIIISFIALISSIFAYWRGLAREKKIITLNTLSKLRTEYRGFGNLESKKKKEYLNLLEFFSIGVDEKVYDFNIVKKMSKKALISQYDKLINKYINDNESKKDSYENYKKLIERLKE